MTDGDISGADRKNSYYCVCFLDVENLTKRNKLFEFLQDTNKKELTITKNNFAWQWLPSQWFHFTIASLCDDKTSFCNGYIAFKKSEYFINLHTFVFPFPVRLCLQTKLPSSLKTGYTEKYHASSRTSKPMKT